MEKFSIRKKIAVISAAGVGMLGLAGCANYSGNGNEFMVEGQVTDPGEHSLKARITTIEYEHGEAEGWFEVGHIHQLHDNCDCHGALSSNKRYGTVLSVEGYPIQPSDVSVGACIRFIGRIRADHEGKTYHNRPVYNEAQVEQCARE
jgi:hypothetical protein